MKGDVKMEDVKMQMFCNKQLWKDTIDHSVDKNLKEVADLASSPIGRLAIIDAIENGRYVVTEPTVYQIPKANGKIREVFCNTPLDRLVLTMINHVYYELYSDKIHPSCVSYQKHIGVSKVIKRVLNAINGRNLSGYKIDIHAYFDSVDKPTLFKALNEFIELEQNKAKPKTRT